LKEKYGGKIYFWKKLLINTVFSFPDPVNEVAARFVASIVLILTVIIIIFDIKWLQFILAYGFLARVLTGPTLSPIGLLATKLLVPLFGNHNIPVAGAPKRFAQFVGLIFSIGALVLTYIFGLWEIARGLLIILASFAFFESVLGFCAGCFVYRYLIRWGLVHQCECEQCANLS